MNGEKFLYFNTDDDSSYDAENAVYVVGVSKFRGFGKSQAGTNSLSMFFEPIEGSATTASSVSDEVRLTITAEKQQEVMKAILEAMDAPRVSGTGSKNMYITIADTGRSKFLKIDNDSDGNAVAITGAGLYITAGSAS
tara:strand:- start:378 stop:791 length:414 start_codon:yes stop_codon:yes gene_type:complete